MSGALPGSAARITFAARVERYARAVLSGEIVAGKWIKAACQRQLDDLERSESGDPEFPYRFCPEAIGRVCNFLQCLPHIKGKWARPVFINGRMVRPTIVLEDWQVFAYGVPFGWVHKVTGLRRFRWVYDEVARKNAKSTPCAGLGLYLGFADGEPGAEVYSLATKEKQARIVWGMGRSMVLRDAEFRYAPPSGLGVGTTRSAIFQDHTESKYEPLGRDSETQDGLNTHGFVADELHAWKDRTLWDVLASSVGAREQPMGIAITTAGYNSTGICMEQREYVQGILNTVLLRHGGMGYKVHGKSIIDETYFGMIYTLDTDYADGREADKWSDSAVWPKANPNLGVSVFEEELAAACNKAVNSPGAQAEFRTKRCNEWLGSANAWMDMVKWDACANPDLDEASFAGETCWTPLDAAFKTDVFAKIRIFRRGNDYYAFGSYWLPETRIDPIEYPDFYRWHLEGRLVKSPGPVIDIQLVKDALEDDRKKYQLREVPFDPSMLTQFASEMLEAGFPMVEIRPTFGRFSEPMKFLEELVLTGRFHHNGDPVLRWMIANILCGHKGGLIYPMKQKGKEDSHKIDGGVALIMGLGRAMLNSGEEEKKYQMFFA